MDTGTCNPNLTNRQASLDEDALNEACWTYVAEVLKRKETISGMMWNDLKPILRALITEYLRLSQDGVCNTVKTSNQK